MPEEILKEVTCEVLCLEAFDERLFKKQVTSIIAFNDNILVFKLTDETEVTKKWKNKSRRESWTPEKRELARRRSKEQWQEKSQ